MTTGQTTLSPPDYAPDRSFRSKVERRLTQWRITKKLPPIQTSLITFSFDDFPKSAADTGAEIMDAIGAKAIYYACSGLEGKTILTGEQYRSADLLQLIQAGHEIGAHTHTHLDCSANPLTCVLNDIEKNLTLLKHMGAKEEIEHFAYPYGETTTALKSALTKKFQTCRGILPGLNAPRSDSMQLRAMELTPDSATTDRAVYAIEKALTQPVWLHIFTHDIRNKPSDYGTTPAALTRITRIARDSKIPIVTPTAATNLLAGANA